MTQANKILLTGGSGFLGAWTIKRLLELGKEIICLDLKRNTSRLDLLLPPSAYQGVLWAEGDISCRQTVDDLFAAHRPDRIIHLAALQIPACRAKPAVGALVNVVGHVNIFAAACRHGIDNIVYTSSIAARPRGEANAPANLYGVYKKTCEEVARIFYADHGLSSIGLRPHIVYGVGRDEGDTSVMTRAMQAAALGERYEIPFSTQSCFQYAGDVAEIFARCIDAAWDGCLLSDLSTTAVHSAELVTAIETAVPDAKITSAKEVRQSPTEGFETAPLEQIIGELPATALSEGVAATIEMFRALRERGYQFS